MRELDAETWHGLSPERRADCKAWLARHGIEDHTVYHYAEVRPGLFRISGYDRDAFGVVIVNGEPVCWQRDVIDECPPPFWPDVS